MCIRVIVLMSISELVRLTTLPRCTGPATYRSKLLARARLNLQPRARSCFIRTDTAAPIFVPNQCMNLLDGTRTRRRRRRRDKISRAPLSDHNREPHRRFCINQKVHCVSAFPRTLCRCTGLRRLLIAKRLTTRPRPPLPYTNGGHAHAVYILYGMMYALVCTPAACLLTR